MQQISIIGCGTMGVSIGLSFGLKNYTTIIYSLLEREIEVAKKLLERHLKSLVETQYITAHTALEIQSNIHFTTSLAEVAHHSPIIIEAIPENLELKQSLYYDLEKIISDKQIIASNTSGILPSQLAKNLNKPERFLVCHFWNPAHLIPLVEIIPCEHTNNYTLQFVEQCLKTIDKKTILVNKEILGFIGNRLQYAMLREAIFLYENNYASIEDIDAAVTYGIGRRYCTTGPLQSADLGGLDVFYNICEYLFEDLSRAKTSNPTLQRFVEDNQLGLKTSKGFYDWTLSENIKINELRNIKLIQFLKEDVKN